MQIWDTAISKISEAAIFGFAFRTLNVAILNNTVDCVWLVYALRFEIPMIALFLMTYIATFLLNGRRRTDVTTVRGTYMNRMRTAFTLVLVLFSLMGLTVHFWNFMWIFGGCAWNAASLREQALEAARVTQNLCAQMAFRWVMSQQRE